MRVAFKRCWVALVFAGLTAAAQAQVAHRLETAFPSDGKDPRQAGGAELLQVVCPGAVEVGKDIGCKTPCPDYTDFPGDNLPWSLEVVTFGHFLSPTSEDAVLSMGGCEPHSLNFGGTILLTKKSQKWSMLWYRSGVQTARCHKVLRRDRREILVCIATEGAQGNNSTELYVEDLLNPKPTLMAGDVDDGGFFAAFDDTATCGWQQEADAPDTVIRTHIDKVQFSTNAGTPSVLVLASFGKKRMTPEDVKACRDGQDSVLPSVKSYRMDFLYDGHGFEPTPSSAAAVQIFNSR
jgi:hypothetical protein